MLENVVEPYTELSSDSAPETNAATLSLSEESPIVGGDGGCHGRGGFVYLNVVND